MKDNRKKETIILASAAFILLSALTTTGLYIRTKNLQTDDNGYVVDLSSIEEAIPKSDSNTPNTSSSDTSVSDNTNSFAMEDTLSQDLFSETELDYDPDYLFAEQSGASQASCPPQATADPTESASPSMTAPSEITPSTSSPIVSSDNTEDISAVSGSDTSGTNSPVVQETLAPIVEDTEALSMTRQPALGFQDSDMLQWPVVGDVLINFSMDKTVYYPTLDQYKYNPGIVISATQGTAITAPATGRVVSVTKDPQYGNTVVMDLGDGYALTCGQLDQITVSEGSFVSVGEPIGCIAAPTKYFTLEGSNLFLKLEKDGTPISPLSRLQ